MAISNCCIRECSAVEWQFRMETFGTKMIRYLLYFCLICQLFILKNAEALIGENVWPALSNQFVFIVSIRLRAPVSPRIFINSGHYCSGSLITKRHVLTAAHCLETYTNDQIIVNVGEDDSRNIRFIYRVESLITYADWIREQNRYTEYLANDIGIMKLTVAVDRPGIRPVTLTPLNNQQLYGTTAIIVGWKETSEGSGVKKLHRARVTILTAEECIRQVKLITNTIYTTGKNILCSSANPYVLTTYGDSGGPVLDGNNVLVGVVRGTCPNLQYRWGDFTIEFTNQYKVNRHLSVDYYREFIENVTGLVTRLRDILPFEIP